MTKKIKRTYSLSIKGEQHIYAVEAWSALTFEQLCTVLSDVSGYRADWLAREGIEFDRLGYAVVKPANNIGTTPTFAVRSSDGGGR